jgi:hypothetical protein
MPLAAAARIVALTELCAAAARHPATPPSAERHGRYTRLTLPRAHVWWRDGRGVVVRRSDDGAVHVYPDLSTALHQLRMLVVRARA